MKAGFEVSWFSGSASFPDFQLNLFSSSELKRFSTNTLELKLNHRLEYQTFDNPAIGRKAFIRATDILDGTRKNNRFLSRSGIF
jgi:hypothetical protein